MATAWAQACLPIPCFGTTHADSFHGSVPCARPLTAEEVARDYEGETGNLIVETMKDTPRLHVPAILLSCHGPFTWGQTPEKAVENAVILEEVAAMAAMTMQINPSAHPCPEHVSEKHFQRKHGKNAYYGQKKI
jgi:L-ribulose-5-phosphate 4-epimerase